MSAMLFEAAMQASEAWEQGTIMFRKGKQDDVPVAPHAQTQDDIKRKIAGNLETVEWADWSKVQKSNQQYSPK
jgi:hypothetical protein